MKKKTKKVLLSGLLLTATLFSRADNDDESAIELYNSTRPFSYILEHKDSSESTTLVAYSDTESAKIESTNTAQSVTAKNNAFIIGKFYFNNDRYDKAETYLKRASLAGSYEADYVLGLIFVAQERWQEAEHSLKIAVHNNIEGASFELAVLLDQEGRYGEAEKYYIQNAARQNPEDLWVLANFYSKLDKKAKAEEYFIRAADRGFLPAQIKVAKMFEKSQNIFEAIGYYELAARQGDEEAERKLNRWRLKENVLRELITDDQLYASLLRRNEVKYDDNDEQE